MYILMHLMYATKACVTTLYNAHLYMFSTHMNGFGIKADSYVITIS